MFLLGTSSLSFSQLQTSAVESEASVAAAENVPTGSALLPVGAWSSICQAHEASRYLARASDDGYGYWMRNPGQRWHAFFDDHGFTARPERDDWTWGLDLKSYGFRGHECAVSKARSMHAEGGRVVRVWDEALEEWYVNDRRGLEHGFTLKRRPGGGSPSSDGPLVFELEVRGELIPEVLSGGISVRFLNGHGLSVVNYSGLSVFDADGVDLHARFERSSGGLLISIAEQGARYPLTIDPVAQQAFLKASNTDGGDAFGQSVSVSGDTVVVGSHGEASAATGVNGDEGDNSAGLAGAAYVFVRNGTSWTQEAYLKASNTDAGDFFGRCVSVSGDTIVVGAPAEDSAATGVGGDDTDNNSNSSGAAYVFVRNGSSWSQQAYLKGPTSTAGDGFGGSVSLSGDRLVVGSVGNGPAQGAAYVFVRNGTSWTQEAFLQASNMEPGDQFGYSVSISGDTVVVGANREASAATGVNGDEFDNTELTSGAAYVFVRSGMIWSQQAYLKASNAEGGDNFGLAVSVSGDTVLVGAHQEDSATTGVNGIENDESALRSGAAYVFVRDGMSWSQEAYLKASNTDADDNFGNAVSVSGDRALVGANNESSGSTGINSDDSNDSTTQSGAAYVFERIGATWSQEAYLKASNTGATDFFGWSVSVSGDIAIVGANRESSDATGVNGDEGNENADASGAAYLFNFGDCDGDGIADVAEVDMNGDGVPDECQPIEFCFGVQCNCDNDDPAAGCRNSSGTGAHLIAPSSYAPGAGPLTLTVESCPPNNLALIMVADALQPPVFVGDGRMCLAGPSSFAFRYMPVVSSALGELQLIDATAQPPSRSFGVGDTYYFQVWYRDVFCTPLPIPCISPCGAASNFTNVAGVLIVP